MGEGLTRRKIHPRNLTARADHWVRGNPVSTRPESGVDNCYPGLELDHRNLEKRFFPGLEFEFHLGGFPPLLRSVDNKLAGRDLPITSADLGQSRGEAVYLWAVLGTFGTMASPSTRVEQFGGASGVNGLSAWRIVHDLEPGPVAVLLAHRAAEGGILLGADEFLRAIDALRSGRDVVQRDVDGKLDFAVLFGARADYLVDGVINPDLYEPGDLTRSLCAPWQYDFTDCGCFYWASNKPDLVAVQEGGPQLYNFQRAQRNPDGERPVEEILADKTGLLTYFGWDNRNEDNPNRIMTYHEVMNNWQALTPVFNKTEARHYTPKTPTQLPPGDVLARAEILRRLRYLATVEHGLMVEYLYAHYSVNAPRTLPDRDDRAKQTYDVARSVLSVAIDEMRHFRWVNEMLRELGQPIELGRVSEFEDLDKDERFVEHRFGLRALSMQQLNWFIEVEKPSDKVDPERAEDTIDGLYTRLMLSILQGTEFSDEERVRLVHLIKLIIDEGFDHFTRFSNLKTILEGFSRPWLRDNYPNEPKALADGHAGKFGEIAADRAYGTVLTTLNLAFSASNRRSDFLQAARFAMYALDDAAHEVIARGGAPLFTSPKVDELAATFGVDALGSPRDMLENRIVRPMQSAVDDLRASGSTATADSMEKHYQKLVKEMVRLL